MQRELKILIRNIAKDLNISIADVERIYRAPFDLQAIVMKYRCDKEKGIYPSMRIPYFLLFYCPPWNRARLQRKLKKKRDEAV
jgi:hypothetical protein